MARRLTGDLEDEFLANGAGEVVVGVGDDDEGTGAADDAIGVVEIEVLIGRIAEGARPVVDDGEAVDRHPGGDGAIAGGGHLLALVVGPVAREIDDLAHAGEAVALEERQRVVDGAANRRPGTGEDRDFRELLRKRGPTPRPRSGANRPVSAGRAPPIPHRWRRRGAACPP